MIEGALYWAAHGIPVFPCKADKRPLTKNGFKDAVTDEKSVRDLFAFYGDAAEDDRRENGCGSWYVCYRHWICIKDGTEQWMQDLVDSKICCRYSRP